MVNDQVSQLKRAVSELEVYVYNLRALFANPEPLPSQNSLIVHFADEYKKICEISLKVDSLKREIHAFKKSM